MGRALWKLIKLALVFGALIGGAYYALGRYGRIAPKLQSLKAGTPEKPAEKATRWDAETEEKRIEHNRKLIDGLKDALRLPGGEDEN